MKKTATILALCAVLLACTTTDKAVDRATAPEPVDNDRNLVYSSVSVWAPADGASAMMSWHGCGGNLNCQVSRMEHSGASRQAIEFVKSIDGDGFLTMFLEKGRVDLGEIIYPNRANTNQAYVMLNGTPKLVSTELDRSAPIDISQDPHYPKVKERYAELALWGASAEFVALKRAADGGQRFLFSYPLIDGCHACGIPWSAQIEFRFGVDGMFKGIKLVKLYRAP